MEITLKNISTNERLSEETLAFAADVYVDGVKTLAASNNGHGGCNRYHRYPGAVVGETEITAWLKANKTFEFDFEILDQYLGELLEAHTASKAVKAQLSRNYCVIDTDGGIRVISKAKAQKNRWTEAQIASAWSAKGWTYLNALPLDEAVAKWIEAEKKMRAAG